MKLIDLHDLLRRDYIINNRVEGKGNMHRFQHLLRKMNGADATEITPTMIEAYKVDRLLEGAARQTINNELAQLRRSFNIAIEMELLPRAPKVRLLAVDNVRQGFLKPDEFTRLHKTLEVLDQAVADIMAWLYLLGWRRQEVVDITWSEVDVQSGTVSLPAARSKNRTQRTIRVGGDLHALLRRRWVERQGDAIFHRRGRPVKDFRGSWARAVKALGRPELLVHDARRSFARNALLAGVPVKSIMEIGGWKTMSVFLRYCILDEDALAEALDQVSSYVREKGRQKES